MEPEQIGVLLVTIGAVSEVTVMVTDVGDPHCPIAGVKVYVFEVVLLTTAGLHTPVIPLVDGDIKVGTTPSLQIVCDENGKVGNILVLTVTLIVVSLEH